MAAAHEAPKRVYTYKYPHPAVTVDNLIFCAEAGSLFILLIQRGDEPFTGRWALPGGHVDENESLDVAAARELREETSVEGLVAVQAGAYGDAGRDPRGHYVTIAYIAFTPSREAGVRAGDDAADAKWYDVRDLPALAFDHARIIRDGLLRLARHVPARTDPELERALAAVFLGDAGTAALDAIRPTLGRTAEDGAVALEPRAAEVTGPRSA